MKKINCRVTRNWESGIGNRESGSMFPIIARCSFSGIANNNPTPCSLLYTPCLFLLTFFFLVIFTTSCARQSSQHDGIIIAVSIPPQAWFVSQISGDKADALILVPPGQNPHNYEPTPRQIQSLSKASAWILSGSEFEITLRPKIEKLFSNLMIVDGTEGVKFRLMEDHDCDDHHHNHDSPSAPDSRLPTTNIDRHTWLGRGPAKILALHVTNALSRIDSGNDAFYRERYDNLIINIDSVFDEIVISLVPLNGKSVFVYHPSFGYFLDEFGIHQEAVETGGKEPAPRELNSLITKIIEEKPAAIFVQAQFPVNAAKTLADAAGAQVVELDPLAQDWLENIKSMGLVLYKIIPEK